MKSKVNLLILIQFSVIIICNLQNAPQNKIPNGEPVTENEFPYIVSIQCKLNATETWKHLCHGTIIHKKWIITSIMCGGFVGLADLAKEPCRIALNTDNTLNLAGTGYEYAKMFFAGNPQVNKKTDAALFLMKQPFTDANLKPIKISKQPLTPGTKLQIASWPTFLTEGKSTRLKKKSISVQTFQTCEQKNKTYTEDAYMCADVAACFSDNGAPLVIKGSKPENDVLAGYVGLSMEFTCNKTNEIHSMVSYYNSWVEKTFKENGDTLTE